MPRRTRTPKPAVEQVVPVADCARAKAHKGIHETTMASKDDFSRIAFYRRYAFFNHDEDIVMAT
jgi:hypothetical protein